MRAIVFFAVSLLLTLSHENVRAADRPSYTADAARSAVSNEKLIFPLDALWEYKAMQGPAPAWPEPGKELHRIDLDYAFQPVVAAGKVFFASSSDDTVRALDLSTGRLVWRFTTGGPLRFAPAAWDGKLFVASDDGILYCLDRGPGPRCGSSAVRPARTCSWGMGG